MKNKKTENTKMFEIEKNQGGLRNSKFLTPPRKLGGKKMAKMQKQTMALIVITILLVIAVSYISVGKYQQSQTQKQLAIYQQGAQYGYEQAITQLVQQAATCQQVPITLNNQTINMIAVECLQRGG